MAEWIDKLGNWYNWLVDYYV